MSDPAGDAPALGGAAEALETELRRYEELVETLRHAKIDSEKGLRRASQTLLQVQASDQRLATLVQALVAAVGAASARQQTLAGDVRASAERLGARSTLLGALLQQWEALGAAAAEVNALVQQLTTDGESGGNGVDRPAALREVEVRLGRLAEEAGTLGAQAEGDSFPDLARQAESLRLQLLSAGNKLKLLRAGPGS
jgi:chromosome segregation ATPase